MEFSAREQSGSWGRRGREPLSLKPTVVQKGSCLSGSEVEEGAAFLQGC